MWPHNLFFLMCWPDPKMNKHFSPHRTPVNFAIQFHIWVIAGFQIYIFLYVLTGCQKRPHKLFLCVDQMLTIYRPPPDPRLPRPYNSTNLVDAGFQNHCFLCVLIGCQNWPHKSCLFVEKVVTVNNPLNLTRPLLALPYNLIAFVFAGSQNLHLFVCVDQMPRMTTKVIFMCWPDV